MGVREVGRIAVVGLVILLIAGGLTSAPADGQSNVPTDTVVMTAQIQPDGDVQWSIEYRTQLATDNETAAFRSLQEDIRQNGSAYEERFRTRIDGLVQSAENSSEREMDTDNVSVSTDVKEVPQRYGVVTYTFTWEGFAAVTDDQIRLDGALDGLYLNSETTLVVSWPDGYTATTVTPEPADDRNGSAVWAGEMQFAPDEPRIVLEDRQVPPERDPENNTDNGGSLPIVPAISAIAVLVIVTGIVGLYTRDNGDEERDALGEGSSNGTDSSDEGEGELLTNEEKVLREMRKRDGRMKQKDLVDELGWSDTKTSRVVSEMRDEGVIEGFRLGRENILELPDEAED